MKPLATALLTIGLFAAAMPLALFAAGAASDPSTTATTTAPGTGPAGTTGSPILFGMDSASAAAQAKAGVPADYGTLWVGPWTLTSGWGGPDAQLAAMKSANVTPAVHLYYWGDDITPSCVENGCWSSLHNAQKDRAHWATLATQMTDHLSATMGGKPVMVFLESEFNKGGIETYEPFDGYMADMANGIHARYPAAQVVLAFGNWGSDAWGTFDRTAAASDLTGIQGMRGSTHETGTAYSNLYDSSLAGAKKLQALFHKPVVLTDIALSSYPEPTYLQPQADTLKAFFTGMPALKSAGVTAMIYRSWADSPNMDTANYYGMAERYWGVANSAGPKASAQVWTDGVAAERASAAPAPAPAPAPTPQPTSTSPSAAPTSSPTSSSSSAFTATFAVASGSNEWWEEAKVTANANVAKVEYQANGAWHALALKSWGNWATNDHVVKGTMVAFRATDAAGRTAASQAQPWLGAAPAPAPATTSPAPKPAPAFTASFAPKSVGNDWWVETGVSSSQAVTKVEASLNGGAFTALPKDNWGTYAASLHAPNGTKVVFRATNASGATATSPVATWT